MISIYSRRATAVISVVSFIGLSLLLTLVDPTEKPVVYTFLPVVLSWTLLVSACQLIVLTFSTRPKRLHFILVAVGVTVGMLLFLLSGLGQLTIRDILLSIGLIVVCTFYFYRSWG